MTIVFTEFLEGTVLVFCGRKTRICRLHSRFGDISIIVIVIAHFFVA